MKAPPATAATTLLKFGDPTPFSYDQLIAKARDLSRAPYQAPPTPDPAIVQQNDVLPYGRITYKPEAALFADGPGLYPITFKLVGRYFPKSVRMNVVAEGQAREILYTPDYFNIPDDHPMKALPSQPGAFAGFWVQDSRESGDWTKTEPWATWLGASYWRARGDLGQVGLSARGIAVNTGDKDEEFPDFTQHWFETPKSGDQQLTIYSLLDGPSITGAYRFTLSQKDGDIVEVEKHLFLRQDVRRLGLSPMTSMFWMGENYKRFQEDWRPEVHDSDGLEIWTSDNQRLWRPLATPRRIVVSSFADTGPKGFGLMQRDRNLEHYLDYAAYERRPSLWIEPVGNWGQGTIQLVEIPTDDEIYDNIACFWNGPAEPKAGAEITAHYRQHWRASSPVADASLAHVRATRIGRGGEPGFPHPAGTKKFFVEFEGTPLATFSQDKRPVPDISASAGKIDHAYTYQIPTTQRWAAIFDLDMRGVNEAVELRLQLKDAGGKALSETWLYQVRPEDLAGQGGWL
ncbi:glucan biosynthesis protein [Arboricoccus pini]|nr:glucan biosynthesis protein D [Arboricoccus pini]